MKNTRRVLALLLTLLLVLTLIPAGSSFAASKKVAYIDGKGIPRELDASTTPVKSITAQTTLLKSGWYIVDKNVYTEDTIVVSGNVNIILTDNHTLTIDSWEDAGIRVPEGSTLTIYSQSLTNNQGKIVAYGTNCAAGIGGYLSRNGSITINGGNITAYGGFYAAGIGGGFMENSGDITINNGYITAYGGSFAPAIGGKNVQSATIKINGGMVYAYGGETADGIGAGANGSSQNIFVTTNAAVFCDNTVSPTTYVENTGKDLKVALSKRCAYVLPLVKLDDRTTGYETLYQVTTEELGLVISKYFKNDKNTYVIANTSSGVKVANYDGKAVNIDKCTLSMPNIQAMLTAGKTVYVIGTRTQLRPELVVAAQSTTKNFLYGKAATEKFDVKYLGYIEEPEGLSIAWYSDKEAKNAINPGFTTKFDDKTNVLEVTYPKTLDAGTYYLVVTNNRTSSKPFAVTVDKRKVTLTSASDSKVYDGTPLTNDSVTLKGDGFVSGEGYTVDVTGSITYKGLAINTFTYTLNEGTKASNYDIKTVEGTLSISRISTELFINIDNLTKKYDGTPLEATFTYTDGVLVEGDELIVDFDVESITDAGYTDVKANSYKVMRDGVDVTDNYSFGSVTDGSLTVEKRKLTITSVSKTKKYDGKTLKKVSANVTGDGFAPGEGYVLTGEAQITKIGSVVNEVQYELKANTNADNYEITLAFGKLKVKATDAMVATEDLTEENVVIEDKANIVEALEDLGKLILETELLPEEVKEYQDDIDRLNSLLQSINNAEQMIEEINNLPQDNVLKVEDEQKVKDAVDHFNNLTDNEKRMVNAVINDYLTQKKAKTDELHDISYTPEMVDGEETSVDLKDRKTTATFRSEAPLYQFIKVVVDGNEVAPENYDVREGSTIVELHHDYLKTLANGEHKLEIVSTFGTASSAFTIQNRWFWTVLIIAICLVVLFFIILAIVKANKKPAPAPKKAEPKKVEPKPEAKKADTKPAQTAKKPQAKK